MARPLSDLETPVRALFTDLDGTLTSAGRLERPTVQALYDLFDAGLPVVLVTGRPAGWGHALASLYPFAAVVTENGGVSYLPDGDGFQRMLGVDATTIPEWRAKMLHSAKQIAEDVPSAVLSSDSVFREVDLAIDWNENSSLPVAIADQITKKLRDDGFRASRSSVHINFSPPVFDKFTASKAVLRSVFSDNGNDLSSYVFVGDSLNDAPMFRGFPNSVGVANIRERWDELPDTPQFVTESAEGAGFCEVAKRLLGLFQS